MRELTDQEIVRREKAENIRNLGIDVHFALPYNAQTKPVERDFLKIKTFVKNILKKIYHFFRNLMR